MDDNLVKVVSRLAAIYDRLGPEVYAKAAHAALLGIARAVHDEAERSSGRAKPRSAPDIGFSLGQMRPGTARSDYDDSNP